MNGVIFQSEQGIQMADFLKQYGSQIKDKHVLYVVSTNLDEDTRVRRTTRQTNGGVNLKIGKSLSPLSRMNGYTNMGSNQTGVFKQSGIRVLYMKSFEKRKHGQSGNLKVNIAEVLLKHVLNELGKKIPARGSEIFNIEPSTLFQIIEDIDIGDFEYDNSRTSLRQGKRLLWMMTDVDTGKQELIYADDYDEVLKNLNGRQMDPRTKIITQFYIRQTKGWLFLTFFTMIESTRRTEWVLPPKRLSWLKF
jgi:hypothetical protein